MLGVDSFGWDGPGDAVGVEFDAPPVGGGVFAGFADAVVVGADQGEVLEDGGAAVPPGPAVVGFAAPRWQLAADEHTAAVA